jgi:hypothetical protein
MLSLEYGSPEQTAEFVVWLAQRFPPPDDVEVQLFKWGDEPRVTARTTVEGLLAARP